MLSNLIIKSLINIPFSALPFGKSNLYGMLFAFGIFDLSTLTEAERLNYAAKRHYFWFGMAGLVLARVVDPVTAQVFLGAIAGMGV